MSSRSPIAPRRGLLAAAALTTGLLAGAVAPPAAHADIGGSRKNTVGGAATLGAAPARQHPVSHTAAFVPGNRAAGR